MERKLSIGVFLVLACFCPDSLPAQTPFGRMDRDNDEQLSRTEIRGLPPAFERLDRNNDGYITRQDAAVNPLADDAERAGPPDMKTPAKEPRELAYVDVNVHLVGPRAKGHYDLEKSARIGYKNAYGVYKLKK